MKLRDIYGVAQEGSWMARSLLVSDREPRPLGDRPTRTPEPEPKPERPEPETLASKILSEFEPGEADKIVAVWKELLGIDLDRGRVRDHLRALRKWQAEWHRTSKVGTSPA